MDRSGDVCCFRSLKYLRYWRKATIIWRRGINEPGLRWHDNHNISTHSGHYTLIEQPQTCQVKGLAFQEHVSGDWLESSKTRDHMYFVLLHWCIKAQRNRVMLQAIGQWTWVAWLHLKTARISCLLYINSTWSMKWHLMISSYLLVLKSSGLLISFSHSAHHGRQNLGAFFIGRSFAPLCRFRCLLNSRRHLAY